MQRLYTMDELDGGVAVVEVVVLSRRLPVGLTHAPAPPLSISVPTCFFCSFETESLVALSFLCSQGWPYPPASTFQVLGAASAFSYNVGSRLLCVYRVSRPSLVSGDVQIHGGCWPGSEPLRPGLRLLTDHLLNRSEL